MTYETVNVNARGLDCRPWTREELFQSLAIGEICAELEQQLAECPTADIAIGFIPRTTLLLRVWRDKPVCSREATVRYADPKGRIRVFAPGVM